MKKYIKEWFGQIKGISMRVDEEMDENVSKWNYRSTHSQIKLIANNSEADLMEFSGDLVSITFNDFFFSHRRIPQLKRLL